jgi:uncharacterized phage infection (PIP) family protein YhgE
MGPDYTSKINDLKKQVNEKFINLKNVSDKLTNLFNQYASKKNDINDYNKKIPELVSKNAIEYANLKDEIDILTLKYNNYADELNKLNQQLQDIINADNNQIILNTYTQKTINSTNANIDSLKKKIGQETVNKYPEIKRENSQLESTLDKELNRKSMEIVKPEYKIRSTQYLDFFNNILFFIYYGLVFFFAYILSGKPMSLKIKLLLIFVFILFPFFIYSFQDNLNSLYHNIYKFLFVN